MIKLCIFNPNVLEAAKMSVMQVNEIDGWWGDSAYEPWNCLVCKRDFRHEEWCGYTVHRYNRRYIPCLLRMFPLTAYLCPQDYSYASVSQLLGKPVAAYLSLEVAKELMDKLGLIPVEIPEDYQVIDKAVYLQSQCSGGG